MSILFKAIKDHQLYTRANKRTFRLNDNEDFEDKTNFKTINIELLKQSYTRRPKVKKINFFLALFRVKKIEIKKVFQSQISSF